MRRLQELCGGAIVIDGIDIAKMGLKQLRSSMAIIPQVPLTACQAGNPYLLCLAEGMQLDDATCHMHHGDSALCACH